MGERKNDNVYFNADFILCSGGRIMKYYESKLLEKLKNEPLTVEILPNGSGKIYFEKERNKMEVWQFKYLDDTFCEVAIRITAKTWQSAVNKFHRLYGYGYTITEIRKVGE